jgi:hypothetical protein
MSKKMTKREHFELIKSKYNLDADDVAFIDHELELLAKKNVSSTGEKKLTTTQKANESLKADILSCMVDDTLYSIDQMIKTFPCCAELSTSKVTAMMTQLIKANLVVRTSDKRKSYFHKVIAE